MLSTNRSRRGLPGVRLIGLRRQRSPRQPAILFGQRLMYFWGEGSFVIACLLTRGDRSNELAFPVFLLLKKGMARPRSPANGGVVGAIDDCGAQKCRDRILNVPFACNHAAAGAVTSEYS